MKKWLRYLIKQSILVDGLGTAELMSNSIPTVLTRIDFKVQIPAKSRCLLSQPYIHTQLVGE